MTGPDAFDTFGPFDADAVFPAGIFFAAAGFFFAGAFALPIRAESTISSDMRIALALLVIAACSKSSAPDKTKSADRGPIGGAEPVGTPASGSAATTEPGRETHVGSANSGILAQQAKAALEPDAGSELPPDLGSNAKGPSGKITIASKTSFDKTNLSADVVAEKIEKEHLAALGNCYRATLARAPKIEGQATLALTVKPDGKLASAKATAPDPALQNCFSQAMQTWTFPVPKNADGEATDAGFQVALKLAPE